MIPHGLLDKVDVALLHRPQVADGLWNRPASVGVDAEQGPGSERVAHRRDHPEVHCIVQPDLEVEDLEAGLDAVIDLGGEALLSAAREVVEVGGFLLLEPAE